MKGRAARWCFSCSEEQVGEVAVVVAACLLQLCLCFEEAVEQVLAVLGGVVLSKRGLAELHAQLTEFFRHGLCLLLTLLSDGVAEVPPLAVVAGGVEHLVLPRLEVGDRRLDLSELVVRLRQRRAVVLVMRAAVDLLLRRLDGKEEVFDRCALARRERPGDDEDGGGSRGLGVTVLLHECPLGSGIERRPLHTSETPLMLCGKAKGSETNRGM